MVSSSNQRPANRGFRSVLRCAISHYRQFHSLSAPEPLPPPADLFGENDPAAIGAGLGSFFPLRVSMLSREVTSWGVSQYRTLVLDNIPGNAFPVAQFTLASNCTNYHTVKQHRPPEPLTGGRPGYFRRFTIPCPSSALPSPSSFSLVREPARKPIPGPVSSCNGSGRSSNSVRAPDDRCPSARDTPTPLSHDRIRGYSGFSFLDAMKPDRLLPLTRRIVYP